MIRLFQKADSAAILSIYKPFVLYSSITFETDMPTELDFEKRLIDISNEYPFYVLEQNGEIMGYAYACKHRERKAYRWAVESSIYLSDKIQGNGLGTTLYQILLDDLTQRNFITVYGIITLPNIGSEMLHKKVGFETLAVHKNAGYKLGEWHDALWVEKTLNKPTETPSEPILGAF